MCFCKWDGVFLEEGEENLEFLSDFGGGRHVTWKNGGVNWKGEGVKMGK